jgi:hypothetical protein
MSGTLAGVTSLGSEVVLYVKIEWLPNGAQNVRFLAGFTLKYYNLRLQDLSNVELLLDLLHRRLTCCFIASLQKSMVVDRSLRNLASMPEFCTFASPQSVTRTGLARKRAASLVPV